MVLRENNAIASDQETLSNIATAKLRVWLTARALNGASGRIGISSGEAGDCGGWSIEA